MTILFLVCIFCYTLAFILYRGYMHLSTYYDITWSDIWPVGCFYITIIGFFLDNNFLFYTPFLVVIYVLIKIITPPLDNIPFGVTRVVFPAAKKILLVILLSFVFFTIINVYKFEVHNLFISMGDDYMLKAGKLKPNLDIGHPYFSLNTNREDFFEQYKIKLTSMFNNNANLYVWGCRRDATKYKVMSWFVEMPYNCHEFQCSQHGVNFDEHLWLAYKAELRSITIHGKTFYDIYDFSDPIVGIPSGQGSNQKFYYHYFHNS